MMKENQTLERLCEIVRQLRAEDGCPWDRVQTHESLRPCMLEEAYELISSIRIYEETGNAENLVEELGDVLLQVVMHAQIATEEGLFSIEDVIDAVSEKMIRRHPHVFSDGERVEGALEQKNWDAIKKAEKEGKSWVKNPLDEVPKELPSLRRAEKVIKKINQLYEPQPGEEELLDQIIKSCTRLKENLSENEEKEEISNILFSIAGYTSSKKYYAEQMLLDRIEEKIRIILENQGEKPIFP